MEKINENGSLIVGEVQMGGTSKVSIDFERLIEGVRDTPSDLALVLEIMTEGEMEEFHTKVLGMTVEQLRDGIERDFDVLNEIFNRGGIN